MFGRALAGRRRLVGDDLIGAWPSSDQCLVCPTSQAPCPLISARGWFHHGSSRRVGGRGRPARRHDPRRGADRGGKKIGDAEFPTTVQGYGQAVAFLTRHGSVDRVGVEGAAGYGAGISRALRAAGLFVVEVDRPTRAARRRAGKSDRLDAYHAARSVLAERTSPVKDPAVDGLRALQLARRSAVKARTAAGNQLSAILVMAPDPVRARFRGLSTPRLVTELLRCRGFYADPTTADVLTALKTSAARHRDLGRQVQTLTARIDELTSAANPALRAAVGVGPEVAAQLLVTAGSNPDRLTGEASFAALCGAAPVPASSGKTRRHRLSRGDANQLGATITSGRGLDTNRSNTSRGPTPGTLSSAVEDDQGVAVHDRAVVAGPSSAASSWVVRPSRAGSSSES